MDLKPLHDALKGITDIDAAGQVCRAKTGCGLPYEIYAARDLGPSLWEEFRLSLVDGRLGIVGGTWRWRASIPAFQRLHDTLAADTSRTFDMKHWLILREEPECGTSACLAGFVVAERFSLSDLRSEFAGESSVWGTGSVGRFAGLVLGLDMSGQDSLFLKEGWPWEFRVRAERLGEKEAALSLLDAIIEGRVAFDHAGGWTDSEGEYLD